MALRPRPQAHDGAPVRQDARARAKAHQALSASRRAEAAYVLDLLRILGAVHRAAIHVVHREHLGQAPPPVEHLTADTHTRRRVSDADGPRIGLGHDFLRRTLRFVKPEVEKAFGRMASEVDKGSARGSAIVGVKPRAIPGLAKVIDEARARNVRLIASASEDFLEQIRDVLDESEGLHPEAIAKFLQERVGVSESRAATIAVDQTLKLNASLNAHRQQAAGVTRFRWSSVRDARVRPSHAAVDGQSFSWDEGADLEDEDEPTFPGQPVRCRCVAVPLIAGLDEEAEGAGEAESSEEEDQPFAAAAEE